MADNFDISQGSGTTVGTEKVGGVHYQKLKLIDPTLGSTAPIGIAANPLHVDVDNASLPVTGTFFQATQPVSGPLTDTQLRASSVPISGSVSILNFPGTQPVSIASTVTTLEDYVTGKTPVLKTNTLVTTAITADQVVLTYTVTAGKVFYLLYYLFDVRLTAVSATASILGSISLESPAGTKLLTTTEVNPTTSETASTVLVLPQPIPIPAGTVIRVVCTPAAVTSMTWIANFGGYEK